MKISIETSEPESMTLEERRRERMAFGAINAMQVYDERFVPAALGGGIICRNAWNSYTLTISGVVVKVCQSSARDGAQRAREKMQSYLAIYGGKAASAPNKRSKREVSA